MLGSIILDKLRIVYTKKSVTYEDREIIKTNLKNFCPQAQILNKAGCIYNSFSPAKLITISRSQNKDHNLQMPPQDELLKVLCEIFPKKMRKEAWVSICHISKNIVLSQPVQEYISFLSNLNFPYLSIESVESNGTASLYLQYNSNIESAETPHFRIKFYDKGHEYCKRHESPICKLYEALTKKEIELLGEAYNAKAHTVDMSKINMLRVEIELVQKDKLIPIIKRINNKENSLTLPMILGSLRKNKFYEILESLFNEKLLKYVLCAIDSFEKFAEDNKVSELNKQACLLQLEDNESKYFTALMNELGFSDSVAKMNKTIRKIIPNSILYAELYSALFPNKNNALKFKSASLDLYNSILKNFILIYEVPIWDDS